MTYRILSASAAVAILATPASALAQAATQPSTPSAVSPAMTPPVAVQPGSATTPSGPPPSDMNGAATTTTATTTSGATTLATPADIKAGAMVNDQTGGAVGTIESVDEKGAIVATGKSRVLLPVNSFGKNDKGLVISATKAQLDAQAAPKTPS